MESNITTPNQEPYKASVVFDERGDLWEQETENLLSKNTNIIALRGAGSFNGISKVDAARMLEEYIVPRVEKMLTENRKVAFIFDGDNDDPEYPDIGHIAGHLLDRFHGEIDFYAVQKRGWYKYRDQWPKLRPLHSVNGNEYKTFVFPDNTFKGEHDHFSQHEKLVKSPKYEQWYVGACGLISTKQLEDYAKNIEKEEGDHKVTIFKAPVSEDQEKKVRRKIGEGSEAVQEMEADAVKGDFNAAESIQTLSDKVVRLTESLSRRNQNPYGLLFDPKGNFIPKDEYGTLQFEIVE